MSKARELFSLLQEEAPIELAGVDWTLESRRQPLCGRAAKGAGLDDVSRPYLDQKVEEDAAALLLTVKRAAEGGLELRVAQVEGGRGRVGELGSFDRNGVVRWSFGRSSRRSRRNARESVRLIRT